MTYDHTITLVVPETYCEIAKRVSRALDPDVGGYEAFKLKVTKDGNNYLKYSSPCTASFASTAAYLLAVPEELLKLVQADYALRWPELVVPTLEEISEFVAVLECFVDCDAEEYEVVTVSEV